MKNASLRLVTVNRSAGIILANFFIKISLVIFLVSSRLMVVKKPYLFAICLWSGRCFFRSFFYIEGFYESIRSLGFLCLFFFFQFCDFSKTFYSPFVFFLKTFLYLCYPGTTISFVLWLEKNFLKNGRLRHGYL